LETISADELPNELYRLYETEYGVTVHRAIENLRPIIANRRDASFLDIRAGRPMLEIHRVALTVDGVPVERRISRCDTRRHSYLSEIV
jgi:GntR family transcriptional regulator